MHSREKKYLITRYSGTVCRRLSAGFEIVSWQKSMYRFGGLYREVPIAVRAELDESVRIVSLTIDEESCGSQGKSCDFACLERSLRDKLINRPFTEFSQIYKDAGTTGCLHVFEILSGASAFFAVLRDSGRDDGSEQELVKISPDAGGLIAENILIFLQTGEGREGCIGFRNGLNMNQQYMLKAAAGTAGVCAALMLGIAFKRRVRI